MSKLQFSRRSLVRGLALTGAATALGGCEILDDVRDLNNPLRKFMQSANGLTYRAQRIFLNPKALAKEYDKSAIRQPQRPNGSTSPENETYLQLASNDFRPYNLTISGLVEEPLTLSYSELLAMNARTQITRHDCVEGWSCIAQWTGVPLTSILSLVRPKKMARYVLFECYDTLERSLSGEVKYYETIDMVDALHQQTILAYALNDSALPIENGAPLRLRVERQLGYKHAKYIRSIKLISSFSDIGGGKGGYWEDRGYNWYAGI